MEGVVLAYKKRIETYADEDFLEKIGKYADKNFLEKIRNFEKGIRRGRKNPTKRDLTGSDL